MKSNNSFSQRIIAVISFIGTKIRKLFSWYKDLWVKFTHNKYDEFVYKRGITMAASTLAVMVIVPVFICLILQTTYYWTTYKKETIYLSQSEEIYPDDNIWGVRGCYTRHCDSDSSIYFRIKPSLFHHLWNLGHNGNVFLPDVIGSSVPTGLTQCEVISYGIRMRMTMLFNVYPNILKVTCAGVEPN
ncbi:hypothetical protein [Limnobaculum parvum]|uniref:hypothetical protein n=1 Tax=Limnobaculum parvum TaxID=2172103 RepID=UPI0013004159|nr:hypothetical protein [Limnobaculum parvum]